VGRTRTRPESCLEQQRSSKINRGRSHQTSTAPSSPGWTCKDSHTKTRDIWSNTTGHIPRPRRCCQSVAAARPSDCLSRTGSQATRACASRTAVGCCSTTLGLWACGHCLTTSGSLTRGQTTPVRRYSLSFPCVGYVVVRTKRCVRSEEDVGSVKCKAAEQFPRIFTVASQGLANGPAHSSRWWLPLHLHLH
jgi:hypothetical protein